MGLTGYKYHLPFKVPFSSSGTTFNFREGLLLEYSTGEGYFYGEAAPLPGFSEETLQETVQEFRKVAQRIPPLLEQGDANKLEKFYMGHALSPSLCFGIDTLFYSIEAFRQSASVYELLFDKRPPRRIEINTTIPVNSSKAILETVQQYRDRGYGTFKIKVGQNIPRELALLAKIRDHHPDIQIRIDANRAWSNSEALQFLTNCDHLSIEYCEEPLSIFDVQSIKELQSAVSTPIALDESLCKINIQRVLELAPGTVWIIKPMIAGGIKKIIETIRLARTHEFTTIFTTSLESGIGRTMTAILACGLGSKTHAHGLATGDLFKMDVYDDQAYINNGYFDMPYDPGHDQGQKLFIQHVAEPILGF
jgi:o-succinylbenzoate synthase